MDLNKIENEGKWSEQTTRLNSNFNKISQETESLKSTYKALTQNEVLVVSTLPAEGEAYTIYRVVGISSYSDYMYNPDDLSTPILMATYNNAIDTEPTADSHNLVESGGVHNAIEDAESAMQDMLEQSAVRTDTAQDLTDAQKATALGNLGISGIDEEPTAGSDNLVKSGGVYIKTEDIEASLTINNDGEKQEKEITFNSQSFNQRGLTTYSNGEFTPSGTASYYTTDYIEVESGDELSVKTAGSSSMAAIAVYDTNKEYLSQVSIANSSTQQVTTNTVIIPVNAKYIRCCTNTSNLDNSLITITRNTLLKFKKVANKSDLPEYDEVPTENSDKILTSGSLYNQFKPLYKLIDTAVNPFIHDGYFIDDKGILQENSNSSYSDFIQVSQKEKIIAHVRGENIAGIALYQSNDETSCIECILIKNTSQYVDIEYEINNSNINYVRFSTIAASNAYVVFGAAVELRRDLDSDVTNLLIKKSENSYPICAWIDDSGHTAISNTQQVVNICESFGIKATFGVRPVETSTEWTNQIIEWMLSCQDNGYNIISHGNGHAIYKDSSATKNDIMQNMFLSLKKLKDLGFINCEHFLQPYGMNGWDNDNIRNWYYEFVVRWYKSGINTGYYSVPSSCRNNVTDKNKYNIKRLKIDVSDSSNFSDWCNVIDDAVSHNELIVLFTHSSNSNEWDNSYVTQCVQYILNKSVKFVTYDNAWNYVENGYNIRELL